MLGHTGGLGPSGAPGDDWAEDVSPRSLADADSQFVECGALSVHVKEASLPVSCIARECVSRRRCQWVAMLGSSKATCCNSCKAIELAWRIMHDGQNSRQRRLDATDTSKNEMPTAAYPHAILESSAFERHLLCKRHCCIAPAAFAYLLGS